MRIILDAMGGDNAPESTVNGAILAKKEFGIDIVLVGNKPEIEKILGDEKGFEIVHTDEVITMKDDPMSVIRAKRNSSLGKAFDLLNEETSDALVTSGNTGATLSGATLITKRLKGVRRAALAPMLPTKSGGSLLIDCGANVECTDELLTQFGVMGSIYFEKTMNVKNPKVGLINNGAESSKGTPMYQNVYKELTELSEKNVINFIGNIEGRGVAFGEADVIVADGFTGNILLKTYEGVGMYIGKEVKNIFTKNIFTKICAVFVKSGIDDFKKSMDYKEIGGAPLLGIKKPVIKAHGSSDAYAVRSAIKQAMDYKSSGVILEIEENLVV